MTNDKQATAGAAILAAIQSEGRAAAKVQPLVTAAIKAGDEAAFIFAANGLERVRDKAQRKGYFAILRTRMKRGSKAAELPVVWTVKRGAEGVYSVVKREPKGTDESAKLRKALDLVKANITDPTVSAELLAAINASMPATVGVTAEA